MSPGLQLRSLGHLMQSPETHGRVWSMGVGSPSSRGREAREANPAASEMGRAEAGNPVRDPPPPCWPVTFLPPILGKLDHSAAFC